MSKGAEARLQWRALLTETLPYEVPLIFSNDKLFTSLLYNGREGDERKLFEALVFRNRSFTKPYVYRIGKDRGGRTALSIVHPSVQLRMSEFCRNYAQSILAYCAKSEFSIRRPAEIAQVFSDRELSGEKTFRLGIPHVNPEQGEVDVSHIASFFTYSKVNLLAKFFDSKDFIGLEKRFSRMRAIDVSKCFFNIYTHSITWAVKGKHFSKTNKDYNSFESTFDDIMQKANYNETNGTVVGPEISRVFAEIILQEVDSSVQKTLANEYPFDYAIRRYVDDFFIFANSDEALDRIERVIGEQLENYKLFINQDKRDTQSRPFVSAISLARRDISDTIVQLRDSLSGLTGHSEAADVKHKARQIRQRIKELRLIVARYNVGFHTISGRILSPLRSLLAEICVNSKAAEMSEETLAAITDIAAAILELAFYVVSLDLRVRSTYSICQILDTLEEFGDAVGETNLEYLRHIASEEMQSLIASHCDKNNVRDLNSDVELINLFITASFYVGNEFTRSELFIDLIGRTMVPSISYFGYITSKFCMLADGRQYEQKISELDEIVFSKLHLVGDDVHRDCESYLLLVDYLSSSTVSTAAKRTIIAACLKISQLSNAAIDSVCSQISFVDWKGTQITHLLKRKQLRSVYTWS